MLQYINENQVNAATATKTVARTTTEVRTLTVVEAMAAKVVSINKSYKNISGNCY